MSLLPVFAPRPIFHMQGLPYTYDAARDARLKYINRYSKYLTDYVLVISDDIEELKRVMDGTDKQVIPTICCDSFTIPPGDHAPIDGEKTPAVVVKDPLRFSISPRYQGYLDFVQEHVDRFPYILLGNAGPELWLPLKGTKDAFGDSIHAMLRLSQRFPWAAKKAMFAPVDSVFGREAWRMKQGLGNTPVRDYCLAHQTPVLIFTGMCFLYPDFPTMARRGYKIRMPGEYSYLYLGPEIGPYPRTYYRDYFTGMQAWSGIGFAKGARAGHYSALRNLGLRGCLFFVPQDDSTESHNDMAAYIAAAHESS